MWLIVIIDYNDLNTMNLSDVTLNGFYTNKGKREKKTLSDPIF